MSRFSLVALTEIPPRPRSFHPGCPPLFALELGILKDMAGHVLLRESQVLLLLNYIPVSFFIGLY
jgi:hypothetical protein